jgi:acetylornithine/N-succinyldiaminopimelate aminotransferase
MFAFQSDGIRPDILTMAKALGGGVPVGAFAVTEEVAAHSLVPGDHGTTYGGNPLVTRAVSTSLSILEKRDITGHVKELTPYFEGILDDFVRRYDFVQEHRGMGFMQGLVLTIPVGDVVKKGLEEGLVLLSAGNNVLRMLPPLIMDKDGFDEMHEKLTRIFDGFA